MAIQLSGSLAITGSLTATSQIVAQTLNVQQVTSSIVYSSGSNIFGNSVSNTQQFTGSLQVSSSTSYILGNVGVGTTTPTRPLHVKGSLVSEATNSTNLWDIYTYTDNTLRFNYNGAGNDEVTIKNDGNVGIGTTSPSSKLEVSKTGAQTASIFINQADANEATIRFKSTHGSDSDYRVGASILVDSAFEIYSVNAASTRFIVTNSGSVGIGTTNPSYRLVVNSGVDGISAGIAGSTYGIRFDNGGTFSSGMSTIHGVDATLIGTYQPIMINGSDVRFGTSATERMRITSGGNVGIGTTSPNSKLHTTGNITIENSTNAPYIQFVESGDNTDAKARIEMDQISGTDGQLLFYTEGSGTLTNRMGITNTGAYEYRASDGIINMTAIDTSGGTANDYGSFIFNLKRLADGDTWPNTLVLKLGNVGIGTSSPTRLLELYGPALTSDTPTLRISSADASGTRKFGIEFYSRTGADVRGKLLVDNNGRVYLDDNGGGGVVLQANGGTGNVGIGTSSPFSSLDVSTSSTGAICVGNSSNTISSGDLIGAISFVSRDGSTYSSGGVTNIRSYATETYNTSTVGADLRFYTTSGVQNIGANILFGSERMRITGGGAVCINTTTSQYSAVLNTYRTPVNSNYIRQIIAQGAGYYPSLMLGIYDQYDGFIATAGNDLRILAGLDVTTEDHNIIFYTSFNGGTIGAQNYERMRISYNGNVGIGTTSPGVTLDVNGSIRTNGSSILLRNSDTTSSDIQIGNMAPQYPYKRVDSFSHDGTGYFWGLGRRTGATQQINAFWVGSSRDFNAADGINVITWTANEFNGSYPSYTVGAKIVASGVSYFNGGNVGIGTTSPDAIFHVAKASSGGVGGQVVIDNNAGSALGNTAEISFLTDAGASGSGTRNARILAVNENAGNGAARLEFHTWNGTSAERMRIASDGIITTPFQPAFRAGRSSSYSVGTNADIVFNSVSFNIGSHYNSSTGVFTAPAAGIYYFAASVIWESVTDGQAMDDAAYIYVNGSVTAYDFRRAEYVNGTTGNGGYYTTNINTLVSLAANDTVTIRNNRALTIHGNVNFCWFVGYLLG